MPQPPLAPPLQFQESTPLQQRQLAATAAEKRKKKLEAIIAGKEVMRQKKPPMSAKEKREDAIRRRGRVLAENLGYQRTVQESLLRRVQDRRQLFRPKLGEAKSKAKLADAVPHYKDPTWQRDHLIYQDAAYRVYIREIAFAQPDRFNISEHLYQIRVRTNYLRRRRPTNVSHRFCDCRSKIVTRASVDTTHLSSAIFSLSSTSPSGMWSVRYSGPPVRTSTRKYSSSSTTTNSVGSTVRCK
jgi:hypothetical protein